MIVLFCIILCLGGLIGFSIIIDAYTNNPLYNKTNLQILNAFAWVLLGIICLICIYI